MNKLKDEFIKAIMQSLKIEKNPFIYATIDDFISHVQPKEYKLFMSELFGTQHQYLNGLDRIAKVAEQFKPQDKTNEHEHEAKRLIDLCRAINNQVFYDSQKMGTQFSDLIKKICLDKMISSEDIAVLQLVEPYCDPKLLISEINSFQDGNIQLKAFIDALKFKPSDCVQIANPIENLRIKR